jgi:hypothetical protein
MRGTADLVIETRAGLVVVDHKTVGGGVEDGEVRFAEWKAQVGAYASLLRRATTQDVVSMFMHLPVAGWMYSLGTAPDEVTEPCSGAEL